MTLILNMLTTTQHSQMIRRHSQSHADAHRYKYDGYSFVSRDLWYGYIHYGSTGI